jgi:hypothetical protein
MALIERPPPRKKHYPQVIAALVALVLLICLGIFFAGSAPPLTATFDLIPSSQTQSLNRDLLVIPPEGGFRIQFAARKECYAYIFQMDSHNNLRMLFPDTDESGVRNPLESEKAYQFPKGDNWFILDQATGPEKVLAFASRLPVLDLPEAYSRFQDAPAGAEKDKYREDFMRKLDERRRGCVAGLEGFLRRRGCFYKELAFWHE